MVECNHPALMRVGPRLGSQRWGFFLAVLSKPMKARGRLTQDRAEAAKAELAAILARRPDLKGKSLEAAKRIIRRETRLALKPLSSHS